jgi:hypothetical protein
MSNSLDRCGTVAIDVIQVRVFHVTTKWLARGMRNDPVHGHLNWVPILPLLFNILPEQGSGSGLQGRIGADTETRRTSGYRELQKKCLLASSLTANAAKNLQQQSNLDHIEHAS